MPLHHLLLDPGDELSLADDPSVAADASFMRAFVPMRSYQRLCGIGLEGLISAIARTPSSLTGRIIVREAADHAGQFAQIVVDAGDNVGFGCGHNANLAQAQARWMLVTNVDLEFEP